MNLFESLINLKLTEETEGWRIKLVGGKPVAFEKRKLEERRPAKVFVTKMGSDIKASVGEAMRKIGDECLISGDDFVAIKLNIGGGVAGVPSSMSDPLVVEGVIEEVKRIGAVPFLCEANMRTVTMNRRTLVRRGIYPLLIRNNVEFVNLSDLPSIDFYPLGWRKPISFPLPLFHPKVKIISVPALKHHWECGVTLASKNMYGAIAERQKSLFHRGGAIDETVAAAARALAPCISILAHRQVGAGLGPHFCIPIDFGYIIASDDALACDRVGCFALGTDWRQVKHLQINSGGRDFPIELVDGSKQIDIYTRARIARRAIPKWKMWMWRAILYPQYFVPHRTQYRYLFRGEPIATGINWLFYHTRGDPWPSRWEPAE